MPSSPQISGSVHISTSGHIISNRLDSVENVLPPAIANQKPEMIRCFIRSQASQPHLLNILIHRPKPKPSNLSAKDKRSAAARKLKQRYARYALLW